MRFLLCLTCLLGLAGSLAAQHPEEKNTFALQLTLTEKYRDTLQWDLRIQEAAAAHYAQLKTLQEEGKIVLAGKIALPPRAPERYELVVLQPMTLEDARLLVQQNPAVRAGLMRARIFPFELTAGPETTEP